MSILNVDNVNKNKLKEYLEEIERKSRLMELYAKDIQDLKNKIEMEINLVPKIYYEAIIIFNPTINLAEKKEKIEEIIGKENIINYETIGEKKLAYNIKEYNTGKYITITFKEKASNLDLMIKNKFGEEILKFIIIRRDEEE